MILLQPCCHEVGTGIAGLIAGAVPLVGPLLLRSER